MINPKDTQRIRLGVGKDRWLSIIQGPGTYAGELTVEVAVCGPTGIYSDEPHGWVTADDLVKLIKQQLRVEKRRIETEGE